MKKIIFIAIVILSIFIINSLIRSIYDLWSKQDLVLKTKQELQSEKEENQRLKSQLSVVGGNRFIEEEARNKLFLVKPEEEQVIIPKDLLNGNFEKKPYNISNWKKWWNLFF